jgi:hypothetical protein
MYVGYTGNTTFLVQCLFKKPSFYSLDLVDSIWHRIYGSVRWPQVWQQTGSRLMELTVIAVSLAQGYAAWLDQPCYIFEKVSYYIFEKVSYD